MALLALGLLGFPESRAGTKRAVLDDLGRRVVLPAGPPRRIVSLAPSVTEILFAIGAGDRLVGVTDLCDNPPAARTLPRVGGMVKPDWETVVRLRPELVVASTAGNDASQVSQAERLGLPLYFTDAPDLNGLLRSVTHLAEVAGLRERGEALRRSLQARIQALQDGAPAGPLPKVLFLVWIDPPVVPGSGTFLNDALRLAGVDSVSSDAPAGWPTYDLETILRRRPDWIVAAQSNASALAALAERPGWSTLDAVRSGRVLTVSEAIERPSPGVVDAMEELQRRIRGRALN